MFMGKVLWFSQNLANCQCFTTKTFLASQLEHYKISSGGQTAEVPLKHFMAYSSKNASHKYVTTLQNNLNN